MTSAAPSFPDDHGEWRIGPNFRPLTEDLRRCRGIYRTGDVTHVDRLAATCLRDRLGIRFFLDLRSDAECRRYGTADRLAEVGVCVLRRPMTGYSHEAIRGRRPSSGDYIRYHIAILAGIAEVLPGIFAAVMAMNGAPFLFGCHAGKDRTGLLAMILEYLCGIDEQTIVQDYARSEVFLLPRIEHFQDKWEAKGVSQDDYATRLMTPAAVPRGVLAWLRDAHGGIDGYLDQAGVPLEQREAIRRHYAFSDR
jgi:protein-tyrosine phosphatase